MSTWTYKNITTKKLEMTKLTKFFWSPNRTQNICEPVSGLRTFYFSAQFGLGDFHVFLRFFLSFSSQTKNWLIFQQTWLCSLLQINESCSPPPYVMSVVVLHPPILVRCLLMPRKNWVDNPKIKLLIKLLIANRDFTWLFNLTGVDIPVMRVWVNRSHVRASFIGFKRSAS